MISEIDSYEPGQLIPALEIEATPHEQVNSLYYWLQLIGIKNSSEKKLAISIHFPTHDSNSPLSPESKYLQVENICYDNFVPVFCR